MVRRKREQRKTLMHQRGLFLPISFGLLKKGVVLKRRVILLLILQKELVKCGKRCPTMKRRYATSYLFVVI